MPGVSKVPGFESFSKTVTNGYPQTLEEFTAYQVGGLGQPGRVLLPLGGKLYDLGLDGKPPRTMAMPSACFDRPSVTPDGRWFVCSTSQRIIALDLQAPLAGNAQVALDDENRPDWPAFGPNSQRFVVNLFTDKYCELGMYASEPPYNSSRLVAKLLFPDLVELGQTWAGGYAHACEMTDVSWSPDGNWIAFLAGRPGADVKNHLYALDLRTISLPSETATDSAKTITIPSGSVHDLGAVSDFADVGASLTWPQSSDTLSMPLGNQMINIDLRTSERHVVLSVADALFCAASWTPDGSQLFFALCRPFYTNPDTSGPPAQLYVYMP